MATSKDLETRIAQLEQALEGAGLTAPVTESTDPKERPDYIGFGSDRHRVFLGLEIVEDVEQAEKDRYVVYTSPTTGVSYRLVDEVAAVQRGQGMDPDKAVLFELRQKAVSFESGPPKPQGKPIPLAHVPIGAVRIR